MKSVRDEKANVQNRIDEVNQNIRNVLPSKGEGTPLAQVLAQLRQISANAQLTHFIVHIDQHQQWQAQVFSQFAGNCAFARALWPRQNGGF